MPIKRSLCAVFIFILPVLFFSCSNDMKQEKGHSIRLKVVASLFPVYDFARNVGGGDIDVTLLLPPGSEPHSYEPSPGDIMRLGKADIFIYTSRSMEPWAEEMLKNSGSSRLKVVDAGQGIMTFNIPAAGGKKEGPADPHIWLDLENASKMVDNISSAFIEKDPANKDAYLRNADAYKARLAALDSRFEQELASCSKKVFIDGGHYTFGYLARRYGLQYSAAYSISPDAEPSARSLVNISKMLKKHGLRHIYHEELLSPRIAETIARETGAGLLKLQGGHNISLQELASGTGFLDIMSRNLDSLKEGLDCR